MPRLRPSAESLSWLRPLRSFAAALSPATVLLLLTGVIVAIGLLLVQSSFSQRNARATARNEAETMTILQNLRQSLVDAESGQRGYLLTQNPQYLAPYDAARRTIPEELRQMKVQLDTTGSPETEDRLRILEGLIAEKLSELDKTVGYARTGSVDAALEVVRTNAGKATMDRLHVQLGALSAAQRHRREEAFAAAEKAESRQIPLLLAMWATLILLAFAGVRGERRRAEAEVMARQAVRLRELNERNTLLAQELNHRVKNLFGVVLSLVGLANREKGSNDLVIGELSARIHALARAHSLAFGSTHDAVTELRALLECVLEPYQDGGGGRIALDGADCGIASQQMTPLALVFHELATNAAKYGALSDAGGRVCIGWTCESLEDGSVRTTVEWREAGGPPPDHAGTGAAPDNGGFGTRMTDAVLRQIEGTIERRWPDTGAIVVLSFRQRNGAGAGPA